VKGQKKEILTIQESRHTCRPDVFCFLPTAHFLRQLMKTCIILTFLIFGLTLFSCHTTIESQSAKSENVKRTGNVYTNLDTLVIGEIPTSDVINTKPIKVHSNEDVIVLHQVLYNKTNDTLDIKMTSSAGWTYPEFNPVILPKAYSENLYYLTTKEQHGNVRTNFYLFYSKRNVVKEKQYRISTVINLVFSK